MSRVEFIKNWTKQKENRYVKLHKLYGSEIVHMIKEETMRQSTYDKILYCINKIEQEEQGSIVINYKSDLETRKYKFFDYFYEDKKRIPLFREYSFHLIDIDAILKDEINYSNYVDLVFTNFLNDKEHPLKNFICILDNKDMCREFNKIWYDLYKDQYKTKPYIVSNLKQYKSFSDDTINKINRVMSKL